MKKIFAPILILIILITACSPSTAPNASKTTPTANGMLVQPTVTATKIPPTPTFTPTPTLVFPVSPLTPVPSSSTKITDGTVKDVQEIARYYGQVKYFAKVTSDKQFVFILDPEGITKYDYNTMSMVAHIALPNSTSDLQMSNDGFWLMIDNHWLADLRNDQEPRLYILSEKIDLLNLYSPTFTLSPDGSVILVDELKCYDSCINKFQIISTQDFKVLHVSSGVTYQGLPTFSPDGKYFALLDLQIEVHTDGSTNPSGSSVGIWTAKDFNKVQSISLNYPFSASSLAFSPNDSLLAVSQANSIEIIDVASGESTASVTGLCDAYARKIMIGPSSPLTVLENSECSSTAWTISGAMATKSQDNVPDFSKIVFDNTGVPQIIPFDHPIANFDPQRWSHFDFLNDDSISFKTTNSTESYLCSLALANSSFECQSQDIREDRFLATDGKYYEYSIDADKVNIVASDNPNDIYYSASIRGGFIFKLLALDPINNIILYEIALSPNINRVVLQDMSNDNIIEKWEGETFTESVTISKNRKFAAMCRVIGYTTGILKDRLTIVDLTEKKIINNKNITCNATAMAITSDGSQLAIEYLSKDPDPRKYRTQLAFLNPSDTLGKELIDFRSINALAYSPDDSILAVACDEGIICFLRSADGAEIYRLKAHVGVSHLAFSPDGTTLAAMSGWGLLSLYAVIPFTYDARQLQSSSVSPDNIGFYWDFNQDDNREGWGEQDWQSAGLKDLIVKDGYFSAIATKPDPELYSNEGIGIEASKFPDIEIRMQVSAGKTAVLYFNNTSGDWAEEKGKYFDVFDDNEFHTYTINMGSLESWKGTINQLRLDLREASGATISIDYIRLLP